MKTSFKLSLPVMAAILLGLLILAGCGGTGSSSGGGGGTTGYTISGILTETDGVTPIAGATVDFNTRSRGTIPSYAPRAQVITGEDGSFQFTGQAAGNYTLRLSDTGYVPLNMLLTVNSNLTGLSPVLIQEDQWDTFVGGPGHEYDADSGYILLHARRQDNDNSIAGASINTAQAYTARGYITDAAPIAVSWTNTVTNNNGMAFFYGADAASYNFTAAETGYTFQALNGIVPIAGEIVYSPIYATAYPTLYTFSGRIEEIDQTAINAARVSLVGTSFNAGVDTDAQGAFSITQIPAGDYQVRITKNNYRPTRTRINLAEDNTGLRYPMVQTAAFDTYHPTNVKMILLRGERESDDQAIPSCFGEISAPATHTDIGVFPGNNTTMDSLTSSRTYSNSYLLFYNVADGGSAVSYTYTKRNYVFADGEIAAADLVNGEIYFAVDQATTAPETFTISGTVRDALGAGVPSIRVEVQGTAVSATSNAQGQFTLNNVPYGNQLFVVNRTNYDAAYAKCNMYFEVTENLGLSDGFMLTCFTQGQIDAMLGGGHAYDPSNDQGYLASWGEVPSQNGVGIPKTVITATGNWGDEGYLSDAPSQVNWDATFAYNDPAIKVFYQGDPGTYTLTVTPSAGDPGWVFASGETARVFAGEITIKGVKAINYPKRTVSGVLQDYSDAEVAGASVLVCRNDDDYDSASLYRATTDEDGAFTITDLPAYFQYTLDMTPAGYYRTYAGFELFNDYTNVLFRCINAGQFNTVTGGGAHTYDPELRYLTVRFGNSNDQPVGGVVAGFTPVPAGGNLGYLDDGGLFDWGAASTYGSQGLAMDWGIASDTAVTASGAHATLGFRSLGSWHWMEDGSFSQLLMRAYTH